MSTVTAAAPVVSSFLARGRRKSQPPPVVPQFEDVSRQAGLSVSHISTAEQHYIIESMSGGIALFDCDDDGKLDIAMVNGSTVETYRNGGRPSLPSLPPNAESNFTNINES